MNSEAEEKAQQENEEAASGREVLDEKIEALEKVNKTLADQNVKLKDQLRVFEHLYGIRDASEEFGRLGIQESVENFVENVRDKEKEVDSLNAKCEMLEKEKQSLLEENKKLTKELEHNKALNTKSKKVAMHNIQLQMENDSLQKKLYAQKDYEDGAEKAEEKTFSDRAGSTYLAGFRHPFNCPVSCVPSVVSFIFYKMKLRVCNKRLIMEIHCTLREADNVEAGKCSLPCEAGKCSLSLQDFYNVGLIEETRLFVQNITDADKMKCYLQDAIKIMKNESHPALFVMKYNEKEKGRRRPSHCIAIMPNGTFIDVQMNRLWEPKDDKRLTSVSEIAIWKICEKTAKEWEEKCGFRKCKIECIECTSDERSTCSSELN